MLLFDGVAKKPVALARSCHAPSELFCPPFHPHFKTCFESRQMLLLMFFASTFNTTVPQGWLFLLLFILYCNIVADLLLFIGYDSVRDTYLAPAIVQFWNFDLKLRGRIEGTWG